jgi:hypothetical protein
MEFVRIMGFPFPGKAKHFVGKAIFANFPSMYFSLISPFLNRRAYQLLLVVGLR